MGKKYWQTHASLKNEFYKSDQSSMKCTWYDMMQIYIGWGAGGCLSFKCIHYTLCVHDSSFLVLLHLSWCNNTIPFITAHFYAYSVYIITHIRIFTWLVMAFSMFSGNYFLFLNCITFFFELPLPYHVKW